MIECDEFHYDHYNKPYCFLCGTSECHVKEQITMSTLQKFTKFLFVQDQKAGLFVEGFTFEMLDDHQLDELTESAKEYLYSKSDQWPVDIVEMLRKYVDSE